MREVGREITQSSDTTPLHNHLCGHVSHAQNSASLCYTLPLLYSTLLYSAFPHSQCLLSSLPPSFTPYLPLILPLTLPLSLSLSVSQSVNQSLTHTHIPSLRLRNTSTSTKTHARTYARTLRQKTHTCPLLFDSTA